MTALQYDAENSLPYRLATCLKLMREGLAARFAKAGYDISVEQWVILLHLWQQDGLTQRELADKLNRSKVAAFKLLEKLENRGLVVRKSDPADGRCRRVYLTEKGEGLQPALVPLALENNARMTEGICDEDLRIMKTVAAKIIDNLKR